MIPEARELPEIKATTRGEFVTSAVFTVELLPGLWRQIGRDGRQGLKSPVGGAVVAHVGSERLVELVRWDSLEHELSTLAGLEVIPANNEGEPDGQ